VKSKFKGDEEIFEMNNGCICCTVRGDLIRILNSLAAKRDKFDYILIETTGLADPAPVAQTFFVDKGICAKFVLDGIITIVDAKHALQHLDETKLEGVENESVEQVLFADRILLSKVDLVNSEEEKLVRDRILSLNKFAPVQNVSRGTCDLDFILGIRSFDLARITADIDPQFLVDQEHEHDKSVTSVGIVLSTPIDHNKLQMWIAALTNDKGKELFRFKGVLEIMGSECKFVFQGVHMLFEGTFTEAWGEETVRSSSFVFIGRGLDRDYLTDGFKACAAAPLRFKVGDKIECNTENGWESGTIMAQWNDVNPYRIKTTAGGDVSAPFDEDECVRVASS
jgi:G3E family GTPase